MFIQQYNVSAHKGNKKGRFWGNLVRTILTLFEWGRRHLYAQKTKYALTNKIARQIRNHPPPGKIMPKKQCPKAITHFTPEEGGGAPVCPPPCGTLPERASSEKYIRVCARRIPRAAITGGGTATFAALIITHWNTVDFTCTLRSSLNSNRSSMLRRSSASRTVRLMLIVFRFALSHRWDAAETLIPNASKFGVALVMITAVVHAPVWIPTRM